MQLLDIRITLGSMLWLSSMPIFFCSEDKLLQPRHPKIIPPGSQRTGTISLLQKRKPAPPALSAFSDPRFINTGTSDTGNKSSTTTTESEKKSNVKNLAATDVPPGDPGKDDKGKDDKGKKDKGKDDKGKDDKGKDDKGKEDKGKEDKGKEDKGKEDKGKEDKGKQGDPNDPQNSLTLSPEAVQDASKKDGKEAETQAPSLTSPNNFINFCISPAGKVKDAVIMNGKQTKEKPSCNGIPMGMVPSQNNLPSCKFIKPTNLDTIAAKKTFKVILRIQHLVTGKFTNPTSTFMAAPIQLDPATGDVIGHTHVVISRIDSLNSTDVPDPLKFAFFKGVDNAADAEGTVSVEVKDGLEEGVYKILNIEGSPDENPWSLYVRAICHGFCGMPWIEVWDSLNPAVLIREHLVLPFATINTAANHQPIGASLAQHSIFDDLIYVIVAGKCGDACEG